MEVTGLDRAAAQRVLTVSNNDLERAINFHLEGNTIDAQPEPAVLIDDDDDIQGDRGRDIDDYEANGDNVLSNATPVARNGVVEDDEVRAPIPVRREQMLQPEEDNFRVRVRRPFVTPFGVHNVCPLRNFQLEGERQEAELSAVADGNPIDATNGYAAASAMGASSIASDIAIPASASGSGLASGSGGLGAFSRLPLSRSAAMLAAARAADLSANGRRQKRSRLGDLFRPPVDLSVVGSLQTVKDGARAQNRWVIVNLQDNAEFASQVLNRDIWSDEAVRSMIAKYFVFWQIAVDMSEGARFQVS